MTASACASAVERRLVGVNAKMKVVSFKEIVMHVNFNIPPSLQNIHKQIDMAWRLRVMLSTHPQAQPRPDAQHFGTQFELVKNDWWLCFKSDGKTAEIGCRTGSPSRQRVFNHLILTVLHLFDLEHLNPHLVYNLHAVSAHMHHERQVA